VYPFRFVWFCQFALSFFRARTTKNPSQNGKRPANTAEKTALSPKKQQTATKNPKQQPKVTNNHKTTTISYQSHKTKNQKPALQPTAGKAKTRLDHIVNGRAAAGRTLMLSYAQLPRKLVEVKPLLDLKLPLNLLLAVKQRNHIHKQPTVILRLRQTVFPLVNAFQQEGAAIPFMQI